MRHQAQNSGLLGGPVAAGLDRAWRFCPDSLNHPPRCGNTIHELLRQVQARLQARPQGDQVHVDARDDQRP